VALDGTGRNSPYAAALLKHIATPGDDLPSILTEAQNTNSICCAVVFGGIK
jgi:uncharacterized caspase-like protein